MKLKTKIEAIINSEQYGVQKSSATKRDELTALFAKFGEEIIGHSDNFPDVPPEDIDITLALLQARDRLRAEMRKRLKEMIGEK